jgi:N-acylglucosamine-6-phosphate 2-epimerase
VQARSSKDIAEVGDQIARFSDEELVARLDGALIVSCQAPTGSPMRDTATIARLAESAVVGGAHGLRVNGPDDVAAIRRFAEVPVIGLHKEFGARRNVITARLEQAVGLAHAGADVIALDATTEVFADVAAAVEETASATGRPVMADVSMRDEALAAWDAGALFVGTTLSGYTPYTDDNGGLPDIELVESLASAGLRVIAEGRYAAPDQVARAFAAGAFAVVVGTAITDPLALTRRFAAVSPRGRA